MLGCSLASTLALPLLFGNTLAYNLDTSKTDSIKSTAKTLADGLVKYYKSNPAGSPIGIFNEDDGYFWWESGAVWNAIADYGFLTGDTQFNSIVSEALWAQTGDYLAFMPPNQTKTLGNDDQSFWGLAALSAAEVGLAKPKDGEWIDLAKNVFDTQVERWDSTTCNGGLRWQIYSFNNGYSYKNAISTGQFFSLAARLAKFTGNQTYSEWADKAFTWMQDVELISTQYAVFDGTDAGSNCSQVSHIQWTQTIGIALEGSAVMYNLTSSEKWKSAVNGFLNHTSVFIAKSASDVLTEIACEGNGKCDTDQKAFKGTALSSMARAAISAPFISDTVQNILQASAKAAAGTCDGEGENLGCGIKWYEKNDKVTQLNKGGLGEAFNALSAVQALLRPQAKSIGGQQGNSTSPSPSASGGVKPSPTGTAALPKGTGAAGRMEITWSVLGLAAGAAILGF